MLPENSSCNKIFDSFQDLYFCYSLGWQLKLIALTLQNIMPHLGGLYLSGPRYQHQERSSRLSSFSGFLLTIFWGTQSREVSPDSSTSTPEDPKDPPPKRSKYDLHQKRGALIYWWDSQGVLYHELLRAGTTATANIHAFQLQNMSEARQQERPTTGMTEEFLLAPPQRSATCCKDVRQSFSKVKRNSKRPGTFGRAGCNLPYCHIRTSKNCAKTMGMNYQMNKSGQSF